MKIFNQSNKNYTAQNSEKTNRHFSSKLMSNEQFKYLKTKHSFHLVDPSPAAQKRFYSGSNKTLVPISSGTSGANHVSTPTPTLGEAQPVVGTPQTETATQASLTTPINEGSDALRRALHDAEGFSTVTQPSTQGSLTTHDSLDSGLSAIYGSGGYVDGVDTVVSSASTPNLPLMPQLSDQAVERVVFSHNDTFTITEMNTLVEFISPWFG